MQKAVITLLLVFIVATSFSQSQRKFSAYLGTQFNLTTNDYTIENNPWGVGLGLQAYYNTQSKFKPTIELSGDLYLADDYVLRLNPDGNFPENGNAIDGMINLFAGSSFHPNQRVYVAFVAGPSFIGDQTLFGVKPSFGFYFSKSHKWTGKISYINIFNRTKMIREDFGSISLSIGRKLF